MTYAPQSITAVMKVWTSNGGVNLGIVGNTAHTAGYHLGKDRIYDGPGPGQGDADYSVKLARDKNGLTNAASAMDLGKLNGTLKGLQKFSVWLVEQCKLKPTQYRDIREIIYSPDGTAVKRWDNHAKVLYNGGTGTGQGDNSHRTHTHISWFRDSEMHDKASLFEPYFGVVTPPTPPTTEDPMAFSQVEVPKGTWLYVSADLSTNANNVQVSPGRPMLLLEANVKPGVHYIVHDTTFKHYYVKKSDVTITPLMTEAECPVVEVPPVVEPECPPVTEADCKLFSDAAYQSGYASGKTDGIAAGESVGVAKGTAAEQLRIKNVLGLK